MSNPGTAAAGQTARASAELQKALADLSLPALQQALSAYTADLGTPGQEPASISKAFGAARDQLNVDFASEKDAEAAYVKQQALQSGMNYNPQAVTQTIGQLGQQLEQQRAQSTRALNFQEAQSGLTQTNQLLSGINQGAGTLLGGSMRFGQNALQSDQLLQQLSQQNQQQGSTYGSLAGSVLGGLAGTYLFPGVGTALGAGLGGALGGAAGGYFGGGH